MTPNFALFLSQDTLRLMWRVGEGWAELGTVATSAPDLAARLGDLREEARKRAPDGVLTKLILPNDYIRYLSLRSDQGAPEDVRAALEGVTPYAVDDLVVDHDTDAGGTYVAAVAREFLDEAETFAVDHGLGPVCFTAIPREGSFDREVFFGLSKGAPRLLPEGTTLGPEPMPMTIVDLPPFAPPKAADASALFRARTALGTDDTPTPAPAAPATPDQSAPAPSFSSVRATPTAAPQEAPDTPTPASDGLRPGAADATRILPPLPEASAPETTPDAGTLFQGTTPEPPPAAEPTPPEVVFASRARPEPRVSSPKPMRLPAGAAATPPVFSHSQTPEPDAEPPTAKAKAPATPTAPARGPAPVAERSVLTRVGGTRFTQVAAGAALVFGLGALAAGYLWLGQDSPAPALPETIIADPAPGTTPAPTNVIPSAGPIPTPTLTEDEARRIYGATGVWQKSPSSPPQPRAVTEASTVPAPPIQPTQVPAPPTPGGTAQSLLDTPPVQPPAPPPPGQRVVLDARGLVEATVEGVANPFGNMVYAKAPPIVPPTRPGTPPAAPTPTPTVQTPTGPAVIAGRPSVVPPTRPGTPAPATAPVTEPAADPATPPLAAPAGVPLFAQAPPVVPPTRPAPTPAPATPEAPTPAAPLSGAPVLDTAPAVLPPTRTRAAAPTPGGVSLAGLAPAIPTPQLRPEDLAPSPEELDEVVSQYAVGAALRPASRPRNIASIVRSSKPRQTATATATATAAPRQSSAAPRVPSNTTVAAQATQANALNLRDISLIGVYGSSNNRRALVRLANGRFIKVGVGDRLDGGRVSAIGDSSLRYRKSGRNVTLNMPRG